jgi:methionyl-tRNA formyltransferase
MNGLTVLQPASLKAEECAQIIESYAADVMVVAAYGLILPKTILDIPPLGCINIHASLLPRWRGAAPIQRAIQAGDTETGITIMQMDEGLDTGDILLQQACAILPADTALTVHDKLAELGASSILQALDMLQNRQLIAKKQVELNVSYAAKLLKSEASIDWRLDAKVIERMVRAFNPFPVCQTSFNGLTIKIWQASVTTDVGESGTVLAVSKLGVLVACGQGALLIERLQKPGGKPQSPSQFLQAMPIIVGNCCSGS